MKEKIIFALCFISFAAAIINAQAPTPTPKVTVVVTDNTTGIQPVETPAAPEVFDINAPDAFQTLLANAEKQTVNYRETFKNLLGGETKTFETYDKNGRLKKQSIIESNLIIYQSPKDESKVAEYRNVVKVDGKAVGNSDKRAADLFEQIGKSASVQKELEDIQKESSRYDKTLEINGLALLQSPTLGEHARPFFDFTLLGRETLDGAEVFVVEYRQNKPSPYILINERGVPDGKSSLTFDLDLPKQFNKSNVFLHGKLWIDAQTFQIRRERRELTAQIEAAAEPLIFLESDFRYAPSEVGIYTPREISFTLFEPKTKDKKVSTVLDTKIIFKYDRFTRSDVEVKSGEVRGR